MTEVLIIILASAVSFVAGALLYRNNAKQLEAELKEVKERLETLRGK